MLRLLCPVLMPFWFGGIMFGMEPALGPTTQDWKPAPGPLATRWAKDVSPDRVLPEYPRPQMVRDRWMSLNGLWTFAQRASEVELFEADPPAPDGRILVPFPPESALSGLMVDPGKQYLHYRREFSIPSDWPVGDRVLLHFGAVDYRCRVLVDGRQVAKHTGGYDPFTADITDALAKSVPHTIDVLVVDESDATDQPRGKQVLKPEGIWYTPSSGIWQTVWLEPVPASRIEELRLTPDLSAGLLNVNVIPEGDTSGLSIRAVADDDGQEIASASFLPGTDGSLVLPETHAWTPEDPHLYGLRLELVQNGRVVDTVKSYFGMRSIAIGKDDKGISRILLNGKPVFQIGPLDQGFWPDGLYTAPTDEARRFDLEFTKRLGFNMVRKHVKVEPARWYYWADKLGLLVWQDMPNGNNAGPSHAGREQFEHELRAMIRTHWNHPSIVTWVVFNEGWGQYDTERVCADVKRLDPSRLVDNASGWTDKGVGDVHDIHNYPEAACPLVEPVRAAVLGEFGGLGLPVSNHRWKERAWGYQDMRDREHLTRRYGELLRRVYGLRDDPGLCAAVYTQTTDVEIECNGLLTYDRAVVKVDESRVARANRGDFSWLPERKAVLAAADTRPAVAWRYTADTPARSWAKADFDDSSWRKGAAGFGSRGTPGAVIGTEWTSPDIWARREFELPAATDPCRLWLWVHHDEDAEVFINGVPACALKGFSTGYVEAPIAADALAVIRPGRNVIAVHCHQTTGGQYIDAGLIEYAAPGK